jgi:hypothetical protein
MALLAALPKAEFPLATTSGDPAAFRLNATVG